MATEDEAREAADGEEFQVEAADLGTAHLQMKPEGKLSSHGEIKDEAKIMDSSEGLLKVTEDQVSEKAPSAVEIPSEHTPNGTASSLNGHMKEGEIPNENPQENGHKDNEQVEASSNGISTDQSNKSNGEEMVGSSGHVESTTEDTSLLKHAEGAAAEDKLVHEDTLQTDEPTTDAQQGQDLESTEVTEDTQHASTSCIPHDEVVAEAPAGVQTSLEPNVADSDALPDATDGNTEIEPAKVDRQSCPEDENIAEHPNQIVKLEDQQSEPTDDVGADLVQEEVPKSKKTDVPEAMTTTSQADDLTNGHQEEVKKELPEETSDPVREKMEETSHESDVSASEETTLEHDAATREPALDVQEVQNQGLAEEIAEAKEVDTKETVQQSGHDAATREPALDVKEVQDQGLAEETAEAKEDDTEETVQQSGVAFEEATPEYNVATIEPSSDIQHLHNVESEETKGLEDAKAEETSDQSNVTISEDAAQEKEATEDIQPVQGLEEEPKSTETVLINLAEDDAPACQPQLIESEEDVRHTGVTDTQEGHDAASEELVTEDNSMEVESRNDDIQQILEQGSVEVKETEAPETREICHERTISASKENSVEEDVAAEGPTCDTQEAENVESVEEITDDPAENIVEASNGETTEVSNQENNVIAREDVSEQQTRELEPGETENTEPVETEEDSDQRDPALLNDPQTESTAEVTETEATETEALPQESNVSTSEQPASEESIAASEITCEAQEVNNLEPAEVVEGNKDTRVKEISDESNERNVASLEEMATEDNTIILTDTSIQQLQEQEPVEFRDTEVTEPQGISPSHIVSNSEESTPEDNADAEPSPDAEAENLESETVTEETKDVESTDAIAEEETPEEHVQEFEAPVHTPPVEEPELEETKNTVNQMDAAVLENPTHEENPTTAESLVIESAEVSSSEATEGQEMPQSAVTQSEDHETEDNTTASEPEPAEEVKDTEATEVAQIHNESGGLTEDVETALADEATPDEEAKATEAAADMPQAQEPELEEIKNSEPVEVEASDLPEEEIKDTEAMETETNPDESNGANTSELTDDVKGNVALADEAAPEEYVIAAKETTDIPRAQVPELEEVKDTESVEVEENISATGQSAEEIKATQAIETEAMNENIDANRSKLTEDVNNNFALEIKAAHEEHVIAAETTVHIPREQEPELEEIKNTEPDEEKEYISARDLPEEEVKETEVISESIDANISEPTEDAERNVTLADEVAPEEHVIETEATVDIPRAQELELEEIKNAEPVEVEENISATDQPADEIKAAEAMETEAINKSTDAGNSELTEDVNRNFALEDEAAHEEHVIAAETTVHIPRAQEPELEEIKNTEPGEVKETETTVGETAQENLESERVTEETKYVKSADAIAEEETTEEHVQEFEAPVDIPPVEEPELGETKNTESVEVHDNVTTYDHPVEEVKDSEATEIAETRNESGDLTEDDKSIVAPSVPDEGAKAAEATADIPQAQEPELEETKNSEPVGVEDDIIASDLPEEEIKGTEAMEIEMIPDVKSNVALADETVPEDHVIAAEATTDIPQVQEPELEKIKDTEPVEVDENISATNQSAEEIKATEAREIEAINESIDANSSEHTEDVKRTFALEDDAAHEEHVIAAETTVQIPRAQEPELEENENTEPVEVKEDISASDLPAEEVKETETIVGERAQENLESARVTEETKYVKSTDAIAEEETPEEHVQEFEAPVDIPPVEDPELGETKNTERVEVHDNVTTNDQPAEEVKDSESIEIAETHNESGDLTEDDKSNVTLAAETAPDEDAKAAEATADIPQSQEPELEEIKNSEPIEVEDNIIASDLPEEEIKDTRAIETEIIPDESTSANISELTNDVKSNADLSEEAAPEEHVLAAEATTNVPRAQEPELEEIKDAEPVEAEGNISATNQSAEEIKTTETMETEAINESTDANISERTEDVETNVALADEAAPTEHVIATDATVEMPRAQEPELEEIENVEHVEVEENTSYNDLQEEEVKETEAMGTEVISESTDADITEPIEDAKRNVALAEGADPEDHVIATEATVDMLRAQEPELEEIENAEHVEVEGNISANDLPAEEVKDTKTVESEAINDNTDSNITELTEDAALANEAVPDIHVDIQPAEEPAVEDINNTEPVEAEESITADDVPVEEINDTEETPHESTDDSLTASAPLADIQQSSEQEAVEDKKFTDTTDNQGEPQQSIVSTAAELTPTEENTTVTESTRDTHVQNATVQEIKGNEHVKTREFSDHSIFSTAEVAAQESPLLGGELASDVQQVLERDSAEETRGIEAVQTEDDQQHGVSNLEKPVPENNVPESEAHVANQAQEEKSTEVKDTEAIRTEEISIQVPTENAAQESSEPGSDPDLVVQSEDSKDQLVKAEETGQSNGASLEEPTAEDNAANETDPLADTKEEHGLESVEGNKSIDATEGEEASQPSQDDGLEELVSESIVATIEPTSDIQQVNDLDEAIEMTATEAIDGEETSCKKSEVATLENPSPTDDGTPSNQKDESSDLGEKTAFTTQEVESPPEEDVVQISGEDTVGISNNIEQIKEQSKAVTDAIQSGDQTNDQDNGQLHNVELKMQVCERSLDVSAIEQPDENVQKVSLDQQLNEDEAIEKQTEVQKDEQKHDDSSTGFTTETLLEPQNNEIGATNLNEDTDVFEAEQTETVATEMLMNEQTPHILQGSIPSIADVKVEDSTEIEEMPEQENAPNSSGTLYTDGEAENYNEGEKEHTEIDAAVAKLSTNEQDGPTDETIDEKDGNGLASSVEKDLQKPSDPAPSNEETLENNPEEPRVHREEEESINKANDDMQAIQAPEQEIVDEVEEKQEMENEDTYVSSDEIQTKPVDEEASVLHSNDSTDTKVDDTMSPYAEMVQGRVDAQPGETEEVEENKGFSSISEYVAEKSKQNDVEQDLSIHPKVVDDNLATAEQNGTEVETNLIEEMETSYTAITEAVKVDEAIDDKASGADGALSDENLETFEDKRKILETSVSGESMNGDKEHHNHALPEQASGSEVAERGLLFPEKLLPNESEEHEESQTTKEQDEEDTHERETGDTEKEAEQNDLPVSNFLMNLIMGKQSTEPEGNLEFEAEKKQEETTKDDSCLITSQQEESLVPIPGDLKVDNKPISEQRKHNLEGSEETHDFKMESEELSRNTHDLEAPVCQNNVQPGMMTEVETRDVKLGEMATNSVCQEHMEAGKQIEEGSLKSNLDNSTNPKASQEDTLEEGRTELRHESLPEDRSSDAVAGQTLLSTEPDMGAEKKLPNDNDDLQSSLSTKREEFTDSSIIEAESTIKEELENEVQKKEDKQHTTNTGGATEGQIEKSHDNSQKGIEAISDEQKDEITEPVKGTEINLVHEKDNSAGSECQDEKQSYKLSNSELDNSEKAFEIQSDDSSLHINQYKQDEFAGEQIVMEENNLLHKPKESILQEEQETEIGQKSHKESDGDDQNCLAEPVIKEENVQRTVESHVQTVNTESNKEQETLKSQVQERDLDVVSAKEAPEIEEKVEEMEKPEFSTDEEKSPKKDKSNMAGEKTYVEKTKDEKEAKSFTGEATKKTEEQGAVPVQKVSQRDLNVVLPIDAPGSEESFVDVKKPEFSTDEEQSPKKDESTEEKSYDEKTNRDEEAKNFTDETPTKIEEREAGQKASPKKHNILSGVGSKVKHQLAKVKKAIIGKPGHTKSELAKS